ncbi:MAG: aminotransferase class I/II-fold pyridoxal phosphate-dependent enzyme [Cyclobacterium sp.]|uniref:trans-sulfuration enzyme family protein n=1 Tax=unclassified Cyclobacterium TaxID=2615055 RepID=UPI0013D4BDB0|nr:aminotransferase class I/II-fold pyridoxal phosphate-dependent enzyme [Cyclobacterium sp. SYSU L10401]
MKPETIAIHGGNIVNDPLKPVIQPITLSTTFGHQEGSMVYSRLENPNRRSLETVLAALENGTDAAAFSSGNAAANAVFQALPAGAHMIAPDDMYHGLKNLLLTVFDQKIAVDFIDLTKPEILSKTIRDTTQLLWMETPSNPLLKISDIRLLSRMAKEKGIRTVVDSTFASPVFQQPLTLGADLVMHSNTKYIGGHSDIIGGVLVTKEKDDFWEQIRNVQTLAGAVPSPFDTYFLTRSIKTLPYRMKAHAANAGKIAVFLNQHHAVEKVFYPGLPVHEGHEIAKSQMNDFGGMLSFVIKGDVAAADTLIARLKYFTNATSLGGVESLIERRSRVQGVTPGIPEQLIRVSVGIENIEDLLEDLEQALPPTH